MSETPSEDEDRRAIDRLVLLAGVAQRSAGAKRRTEASPAARLSTPRTGPRLPRKKPHSEQEAARSGRSRARSTRSSDAPSSSADASEHDRGDADAPGARATKRRSAARSIAARYVGSACSARLGSDRCRPHLVRRHRPALERVVARRHVPVAERVERRLLDVAVPLDEPRAARMEPARARRVDRARDVTFEHDRLPRCGRARDSGSARPRGARPCTGASAPCRAASREAISTDLAEVHHHHAVGDVPDDVQVVRDEDVREPEVVLQVLEQVEDLRLDRDVERRDGLVADDQLRVDRERPRDADALALPARELVREAVVVLRVQADDLEQLLDAAS